MRWTSILGIFFCCAGVLSVCAQEEGEDSASKLPAEYAKKYLLSARSVSPDGKIGVMYPRTNVCVDEKSNDCKDFVVALKPFKVLGPLDTKWPHFQNRSNSGVDADWLRDNSAALITILSKWGPGDIFLVEIKNGELTRTTNLLRKIEELLEPDFKAAKPP